MGPEDIEALVLAEVELLEECEQGEQPHEDWHQLPLELADPGDAGQEAADCLQGKTLSTPTLARAASKAQPVRIQLPVRSPLRRRGGTKQAGTGEGRRVVKPAIL